MNDAQRFALHFGPYEIPLFNYGDIVVDEVRGEVVIVGLSAAKIPWPIGKRVADRSGLSLVVYGGLADAVRRESNLAVCHWWGITSQTVTKWRKALDVEPLNAGSRELFVRYGREERALEALPLARSAASRPESRRKIAESRRGRPRPKSVIRAMRKAARGRVASDEARRKLSEAHKARGTKPPKAGRDWTGAEDDLLRTLTPHAVVEATERSLHAVYLRRHELGLPDGRRRERK